MRKKKKARGTGNVFERNRRKAMAEIRRKFTFPPVRTLGQMSEPEILELERIYGCPVIRPSAPPC